MTGETDLAKMLATIQVQRRPGTYAFVSLPEVPPNLEAEAVIVEDEGKTVVVRVEEAAAHGWDIAFEASWLTVDIHSALEAVGLTAAFSTALGDAGIACNVLAGTYHDHILVPVDRADDAIAAIESLRTGPAGR